MTFNLRNLLLFVLLAGTAAATWMLARQPEAPVETVPQADAMPRAYRLIDAVLLGTGEGGQILFRAYVNRVEKLLDADDFSLEGIRIEYAPDSDIHWEVFAERGFAPMDLTFFDLSDGVRMNYADASSMTEAVIETEAVHLDALRMLALADHNVVLRSSKGEISGTGLEANLEANTLSFRSNVTARSSR